MKDSKHIKFEKFFLDDEEDNKANIREFVKITITPNGVFWITKPSFSISKEGWEEIGKVMGWT